MKLPFLTGVIIFLTIMVGLAFVFCLMLLTRFANEQLDLAIGLSGTMTVFGIVQSIRAYRSL